MVRHRYQYVYIQLSIKKSNTIIIINGLMIDGQLMVHPKGGSDYCTNRVPSPEEFEKFSISCCFEIVSRLKYILDKNYK